MSATFQQYNGSFPYKTDSKNRVTVVGGWRPKQGENLFLMPSHHEGIPMIKVMTDEGLAFRLNVIDEAIAGHKERADRKSKLKRKLRVASVNEQGKLLIPKDFGAYADAGPDTEVMLAAGDSNFEIWNREKYEAIFGTLGVSDEEDDLGID